MVSFPAAIALGFRNYFNFTDRSTRAEYWWWYLFTVLTQFAFLIAMMFAISSSHATLPTYSSRNRIPDVSALGPSVAFIYGLMLIFGLIIMIPTWALLVRRLRDAGYSWPWLFISFVPVIGGIWLLALTLMPTSMNGWGNTTSDQNIQSLPAYAPSNAWNPYDY